MDTTPKILFIINPNAGKRKSRKLIRELNKYADKIDFRLSESPCHGKEIVKAEFSNYEVFVAAGGDGTVNEIASVLIGTDKKLAVFPAGSGNGFAREFGFKKNVPFLLKSIRRGKILKTDALFINEHLSIHISGVGYDGKVAHYFSRLKGRGFLNYVVSTICIIFSYKPVEVTVETDEETIHDQFFMINIVNNRQFGYHAIIASEANPTDGKCELVLTKEFSKWLFPVFSLQLFLGILKPSKALRVISFQKGIILNTSATKFHIDGEPIILKSPVRIRVLPGKLNVVDTGKVKFH
ncbi:diacylglycerol/lipid kinase family protein [Sunxiuqinia sp. A32]|uniref:diacylglycerol/lipid kinase family protein n=1 Tax=Sunxiuqinia sp. A32 TaxID=3461496 RepID=UPI0040453F97